MARESSRVCGCLSLSLLLPTTGSVLGPQLQRAGGRGGVMGPDGVEALGWEGEDLDALSPPLLGYRAGSASHAEGG